MRCDDGWLQLSPSSINVLADCGRCGWRAFRGVPRPRGIFPSLPGGIDRVMKLELDKYRSRGEWPPLLRAKDLPGKPVLRPPRSRLTFVDPSLKVRLVGILDDAYEHDGRTGPLDIKTRGSKADGLHPAYKRQMDLYTQLLGENGWTPTGSAALVYLYPIEGEAAGGIAFDVDVKMVKTSAEEARRLVAEAARIVRGACPPASPRCEYCVWHARVATLQRSASRSDFTPPESPERGL